MERELRCSVLASLADGNVTVTRQELAVLADFWAELNDIRAHATREILARTTGVEIHSTNGLTVLCADFWFKNGHVIRLPAYDDRLVHVQISVTDDGWKTTMSVLLGGKFPFSGAK